MSAAERKSKKIYYTMGEVSEMFDVNASLIRFWETKFDILRPQKNKKGDRLFSGRCRKPEIDLSSGQGAGNDPRRSCPLSETE